MSLSDYVLAEIVHVAEGPSVADVLRRAGARPGHRATVETFPA